MSIERSLTRCANSFARDAEVMAEVRGFLCGPMGPRFMHLWDAHAAQAAQASRDAAVLLGRIRGGLLLTPAGTQEAQAGSERLLALAVKLLARVERMSRRVSRKL